MKAKEWSVTKMPQFTGKKAYVLSGAFFGAGIGLMAEAGFEKADNVVDADVVVFMGGADVDPPVYGDRRLHWTSSNPARDKEEIAAYEAAKKLGKVCFGICRGAQLLHALNDGKLWQHVDNHGGTDHAIYDLDNDVTVTVNSYHHQMLQDNKGLEIVAVCPDQVSTRFIADGFTIDLTADSNKMVEIEIEAGAYPANKCFFVQGHPEVGSPEFRSWTMTRLKEYMDDWENDINIPMDTENQLSVADQVQLWREAALL